MTQTHTPEASFDDWFNQLGSAFKLYWLHWLATTVLAAGAVVATFSLWDVKVAEYFNNLPDDNTLIAAASKLTHYGKTEWYALPALLAYLLTKNRTNPAKPNSKTAKLYRASKSMMATLSISGLVVNTAKPIFARRRPKLHFSKDESGFKWLSVGYDYGSFPSGHSATSVGAWLLLGLLAGKRLALPSLAVGAGLASTRMIINVHHLSDVILGGVIGGSVAMLMYQSIYQTDANKQD